MKACKSSLRLAPANVFGMFPCEVDCPDTGSDPSYLEQDGPLTDKPKGGVSRISSASRPPRGRVSSAWTSRRVWKQDSLSSDQKPKSADLDNASSRQLQWAVEQVTMPSGYNRLYDLWDDEDSDSLSEPGLEHEGPIHGRSHQEDGNQDDQADTHSCDLDKINVSDGNPSVIWSNGLVYEWDAEKRIFVRSEPANAIIAEGPHYAPGAYSLMRFELPRRSILEGAVVAEDGSIQVNKERLSEHVDAWRACHLLHAKPTMATFIGSALPDSNGMVKLLPEGVLELLKRQEENSEILLEKNNAFRCRLQDGILRDGRTQRYTLKFVQDRLRHLENVRNSLVEQETALAARQRDLEEREKAIILAEKKARFCGIRDVTKRLDNITGLLEKVKDSASHPNDAVMTSLVETHLPRFKQDLGRVEPDLQKLDDTLARLTAREEELSQETAAAKEAKLNAEKAERAWAQRQIDNESRFEETMSATVAQLLRHHGQGKARQLAEGMVSAYMPSMVAAAHQEAKRRLAFACLEDPLTILELAKEAAVNLTDRSYKNMHMGMLRQPTCTNLSAKKRREVKTKGEHLGRWLGAHNNARLKSSDSVWFGAQNPDHALSILPGFLKEIDDADLSPYWAGIMEGLTWAKENPREAEEWVKPQM